MTNLLCSGFVTAKFGNLTLKYDFCDLEEDLKCIDNDIVELAVLENLRYRHRYRISSRSRSHSCPRLELILQTKVTDPEVATFQFQFFSKGVYGPFVLFVWP